MDKLENTSGIMRNSSSLWEDALPNGCLAWREARVFTQRKRHAFLSAETASCQGTWPGLRNLSQISVFPHPSEEHFCTETRLLDHSQWPCLGILAQMWILIHLSCKPSSQSLNLCVSWNLLNLHIVTTNVLKRLVLRNCWDILISTVLFSM